ncbi:MAG: hypothetical protein QE263_03375 [Vampirovibrionales bacterium]|nr:hypothetical protein [Vampirovibrionales bacterium]
MPSAFPTQDNSSSHPKGEHTLSTPNHLPLEQALTSYTQGLDCVLPFNDMWAAIDAQLDADTLTSSSQQQRLLNGDDALWDTYADSPEVLQLETRQQLEHLLPNWPQAQHSIGDRQRLISDLRQYAHRVESSCTFVANVHTLLKTPSVNTAFSKPLPLWLRTGIAVASIAALWVLILDPTALTLGSKTIASTHKNASFLATASAPSVEAYVMTYCNDTSLTVPQAKNADQMTDEAMMDSSQVVLMGCGPVN